MLKRINEALPGLVVSILLYGVIVELIGVWFVKDRIAYSIGVWFGIAVAVGMAINLATVIFDSVTMGDTAHATRRIVTKSILRYVVVVILFVLFLIIVLLFMSISCLFVYCRFISCVS